MFGILSFSEKAGVKKQGKGRRLRLESIWEKRVAKSECWTREDPGGTLSCLKPSDSGRQLSQLKASQGRLPGGDSS